MKCVLKMAGLPLAAAQLHSHVCGWADVLREDGRTDGPLCGNQRWLQSSTSSNSAAFHTKKFENLCPSTLLYTFKLTFSQEKGEIKASLDESLSGG